MRWLEGKERISRAKTQRRKDVLCFAPLRLCVKSYHIVVIFALAFLAGCGSDRCPVGGEVSFDGKPVEKGSIAFEPVDGQGPTSGGTIADGKYCLVGSAAPLPGKKTVRITGVRKTGRKIAAGLPSPPGTMIDEIERYIPKIYNTNSTLTCDVSRDDSKTIDFNLKPQ